MPLPPPVDTQTIDERFGIPFPWFTPPFLEQLKTWDLKGKRVFEYGGGWSTIWWRLQGCEVYTVEADVTWSHEITVEAAERHLLGALRHVNVIPGEVELKSWYVQSIYELPVEFDIIVIDGSYRDECVAAALTKIKDGGIIICDNWDQDYVWDSIMASRLLDPWPGNIFTDFNHKDHQGRPWKTGFWQIFKGVHPAPHNDYYTMYSHLLHVTGDYDSHRPMLWMALEHIKPGLAVEFGCGYGSTQLLHRYCQMQARNFISFETNAEYAKKFPTIVTKIGDYFWANAHNNEPVTIVFIDSAPGEQRAALLKYWANTPVLIVHDTEPGAEHVYKIQDALNSFKYRCDLIIEGKPQTTAVSNVYDFERWKGLTLGNYKFV